MLVGYSVWQPLTSINSMQVWILNFHWEALHTTLNPNYFLIPYILNRSSTISHNPFFHNPKDSFPIFFWFHFYDSNDRCACSLLPIQLGAQGRLRGAFHPYFLWVCWYPFGKCSQNVFSSECGVSIILMHSNRLIQVYKGMPIADPTLGRTCWTKFGYHNQFYYDVHRI